MLTVLAILTTLVTISAIGGLVWIWLTTPWQVVVDEQFPRSLRKGPLRRWFGRRRPLPTSRRDHP